MINKTELTLVCDELEELFNIKVIESVTSDMSYTLYFDPDDNEYTLRMLVSTPYTIIVSFVEPTLVNNPISNWMTDQKLLYFERIIGMPIDAYIASLCKDAVERAK
jgi:hypothetical protein